VATDLVKSGKMEVIHTMDMYAGCNLRVKVKLMKPVVMDMVESCGMEVIHTMDMDEV